MSGKCVKCGKITKYAIKYDMDCSPVWCHKKCEEDVKIALFLYFKNKKEAIEFTKDWYKPLLTNKTL